MAIVTGTALERNKNFRVNFDGGNLSSDGGLLLLKEFYHKLGVKALLKKHKHISVRAPDWSCAVRLDSIGYPMSKIQSVLRDHWDDGHFYAVYNSHLPSKRKTFPLLTLERQLDYSITHAKQTGTVNKNGLSDCIEDIMEFIDIRNAEIESGINLENFWKGIPVKISIIEED